jgi:phosphate transport system protein
MAKHLQRELGRLQRGLLSLSAVVEEAVRKAVQALENRDVELAQHVIETDLDIDQAEVDLEEECLKLLALYQPVAIDLRLIVAVLKINNDLERIGDLAVNIAERAIFLAGQDVVQSEFDFEGMARKAQQMVKMALDSLVNQDSSLARQVLAMDDEVDAMNRRMYEQVREGIRRYPGQLEAHTHLLSASRHLERIADHATNIAEDVVYMVEGQIIRHQAEVYRKKQGGDLDDVTSTA